MNDYQYRTLAARIDLMDKRLMEIMLRQNMIHATISEMSTRSFKNFASLIAELGTIKDNTTLGDVNAWR